MEIDDNGDLIQLTGDYPNDTELGAKLRSLVKNALVKSDSEEDDEEWDLVIIRIYKTLFMK